MFLYICIVILVEDNFNTKQIQIINKEYKENLLFPNLPLITF